MHYQVLRGHPEVRIKTLNTDSVAPALFGKAVDQYVEECEDSVEIRDRLAAIEYSQIAQVIARFSEVEIGMDNG
jgi:hypothetical protein